MKALSRCIRRLRPKHWIGILLLVLFLLDFFGVFLMMKEKSFDTEFSYPIDKDVTRYVEQMKRGEVPSVSPIFKHDYYLLKHPKEKCLTPDLKQYEPLRVLYVVKSAASHFERRAAIRKSWGFERRFSDVPIRTVFLLGQVEDDLYLQGQIENEYLQHQDIVQGNFIDTYYNNTLKTAMGLRWTAEHCSRARFYMFVDDDYYVSTRNLLRFLRNPVNYPGYLEEDVISFDESNKMFPERHLRHAKRSVDDLEEAADHNQTLMTRKLNQLVDFDLPLDVRLYSGYVMPHSRPLRHRSSKWFVSTEEYPYNRYPPYVTAGAYVLSRVALMDMYYTSYFTKQFRFDDIWLGLVAKKAALDPLHSSEFYFNRRRYSVRDYKYVVASHGFSDPKELVRVWNQQKEAGNA